MSAVREELLEATGIKPKKNESEQALMKRVMKKIDADTDETIWSDLSEAAQTWYNDSVDASKSKSKKLPLFSEYDEADEDEDDDADEGDSDADEDEDDDADEDDSDADDDDADEDDEDEEEDTKSKKKSGKSSKSDKAPAKGKGSKKSDAKSDKKSDKKADKKSGKSGGRGTTTATIKTLMVKDPGVSQEDLMEQMQEAGFENPSEMTISTVRADFRHTMKLLAEGGHLSEKFGKRVEKAFKKSDK